MVGGVGGKTMVGRDARVGGKGTVVRRVGDKLIVDTRVRQVAGTRSSVIRRAGYRARYVDISDPAKASSIRRRLGIRSDQITSIKTAFDKVGVKL